MHDLTICITTALLVKFLKKSYYVDKYLDVASLETAIDLNASISNVLQSGGHSFYEAICMKFSVSFKFQQVERGGMLCI